MTTKKKVTPKTTCCDTDLTAITSLFRAYYEKSGNTEVALQNSLHSLKLLKKALENQQKS